MKWTVTVDKSVMRRLQRIPNPDRERLIQAILAVKNGPEGLDIRPLEGRDGYRFRVGGWRILLDMDTEMRTIAVYTVGSRGDIYQTKSKE
ncbi:MAG: type II toxin-antitoxin system RelE/ParE family toxin [Fretibacterium sp.]|nr:type II toxin-antitoxin system RelE/ParE family toxin [Fretibacterium sp.]